MKVPIPWLPVEATGLRLPFVIKRFDFLQLTNPKQINPNSQGKGRLDISNLNNVHYSCKLMY